jgi:hypothetical protein
MRIWEGPPHLQKGGFEEFFHIVAEKLR